MTDVELLSLHQTGDESAFSDIVRRHLSWIYGLARRRLGDAHQAEDVAQAVFVLLHRKSPSFRSDGAMIGWLHRSARYMADAAAREERRRQRRETRAAELRPRVEEPGADSELEWGQLAPILDALVGRLSRAERELILLRFYRDLTYEELGEQLGTTAGAARKRVERAIEKLRHMAENKGLSLDASAMGALMAGHIRVAIAPGLITRATGTATAHAGSALASTTSAMVKAASAMMTTKQVAVVVAIIAICLGVIGGGMVAGSLIRTGKTGSNLASVQAIVPSTPPSNDNAPNPPTPVHTLPRNVGNTFDIPKVGEITVDGTGSAWADQSFKVNVLLPLTGDVPPADEFDPRLRLAWNDYGLLVLADVRAKNVQESPDIQNLGNGDSIELVIAEPAKERQNNYAVLISPGRYSDHRANRIHFFTRPIAAPAHTLINVASVANPAGYTIEALLPWSNLGLTPHDGLAVKFQFYAYHTLRPDDVCMASWYPDETSDTHAPMTYALTCAEDSSAPVNCAGHPEYTSAGHLLLHVFATPELAGQSFQVANPRTRAARPLTGTLAAAGSRAEGSCDLTSLIRAGAKMSLDLQIDGNTMAMVNALSFNDRQCDMIERLYPAGDLVFAGDHFPQLKWNYPDLAQAVYGTGSMSVKFYDKSLQEAAAPTQPGRYGAVISVTSSSGFVTRRFVTVCKAPEVLGTWSLDRDGLATFPAAAGEALRAAPPSEFPRISRFNPDIDFKNARLDDSNVAICAADALDEHPSGDPWIADGQWWIGLRRKLYGYSADGANLLDQIKPIAIDPPAPTLVDGTAEAAGMDPGVVGELGAICSRAAREFPAEPMSYCLARNGVIFFDKAYGKLPSGEPVTVDTPTQITSVGKVFTGIIAMMMEEHHMMNFDRPLDRFDPLFRSRSGRSAGELTLRHFFTHMSGLNETISGGHGADLQEVVADEEPFLTLKTERYSNEGYDFIGSMMEDQLGLPIVKLNRALLFDPLGIGNAEQFDAAGGGEVTARELAAVAQLLVNRGAYGHLQWMRPATFDQMLPRSAWGVRGGIGLESLGDRSLAGRTILPQSTFGHQMGDSGIFRIVPEDRLVLVWGAQFYGPRALGQKYNELIFKTVLSAIR